MNQLIIIVTTKNKKYFPHWDLLNHLLQCMLALQSSTLPEAAEVLDILHQVEFESLFYTHDKLAERQVRERSNMKEIFSTVSA